MHNLTPDFILAEIQIVKTKVAYLEGLVPAANVALGAKLVFPDLIQSISVGWMWGQVNGILVHCDLDHMMEISPLLRFLAQKGYRQKTKRPEDYAEIKRRTWDCGDVKVLGFFKGEKCQYVQVGVKEEPIYELKCSSIDPSGSEVITVEGEI